jgi:hypothetical protein
MKRAAILLLVILLAGAGYYLWQTGGLSRFRSAAPSDTTKPATAGGASESATPDGPAASATLTPPVVLSPDELTRHVAELEARLAEAVNAQGQTASSDAKARIERMFDALREIEKLIPRGHFEPAAIVAEVGKDPVALAAWVNNHTALIPYRGTLRGPVGVLMDRMGNSLDRALLLHELLRVSGRQARLARVQVNGAALETLVTSTHKRSNSAAGREEPTAAGPDEVVKRSGIDPAAVETERVALGEARRQLGERVKRRAGDQAAALLTAVAPHQIAPEVDETAWRRDALADHWFVQYRDGALWVGLDAIPGRTSFEPLGSPVATMAASDVPADMRHRLRVRVVAEYWKDGALQPTPVLDHVLAPAEWLGQTVSLRTVPSDWPDARTLGAASDPHRAIIDAALAQREWTPLLMLGTRPILKQSFTDDGRLLDAMSADETTTRLGRSIGNLTERAVGGASGMPGSLPSGSGNATPAVPAPAASRTSAVLTAQWIEYEITAPGMATEKTRRDVFDLLEREARAAQPVARPDLTDGQKLDRALSLVNEIDLLPVGTQLQSEYVTALRASRLLALRAFILDAVTSGNRTATPPASAQPLPGPLMDVAVARAAWSMAPDQMYFDRPNLFARWRGLRLDEGRVLVREDFDIVSNYLAVSSPDPAAAFQARLEQGVLDTNVEMVLLATACAGCEVRGNAAHVFGAAGARNEAWHVLAPQSRVPDSVVLPSHVRARINDSTSGGAVVAFGIAPEGTGGDNVAWWTIDPRTGRTLGIGPDGLGQTSTEHTMLLKTIVQHQLCAIAVFVGAATQRATVAETIASGITCNIGLRAGLGAMSYAGATAAADSAAIATRLDWAALLIHGIGAAIAAGL